MVILRQVFFAYGIFFNVLLIPGQQIVYRWFIVKSSRFYFNTYYWLKTDDQQVSEIRIVFDEVLHPLYKVSYRLNVR